MGSARIFAVAAILATGILPTGVATAHTDKIQIVRGDQPASIIETRESNVRVYRGSSTAAPAAMDRQVANARPIAEIVSSGSRIWFVDRAAGTLSVCRLVSTTQVGEHRIDCHAGALPR